MRVLRHFALHPAEGRACAVYSASLHPDGTILATCGADKKVRLWKTSLLFQETLDAETQSAQTESLATVSDGALAAELSSHTQGVNCVRWNHGGEYLASSSDDTLIFLWEHKEGAGRGGGKWVRAATLRGHAMDVLDLAWGANDGLLASCSIDNRVIVWNTQNVSPLLPPLKVLCGHTNWVKGVAWDPLGRFLASASEDRSVVVWRATDWAIEAKITLPFAGVTAQTFFQRLSWSPDGAALGLPNAAKAQQQIAAVVSRNAWDAAAADLVGHKQPVTVVKFAPVLFRAAATIQCPEPQPHSVVAIGSQDATVSIWTDAAARPLLVLRDCCAGAVKNAAS